MRPVVLIIMDGFGIREDYEGNAIRKAHTPNLDSYFQEWPFTTLAAAGEEAGLPSGFQGSSEVGHLNIGAGRLVKQEEVLISESIDDGSFFRNRALLDAMRNSKRKKRNFHIMGLLSDKGVHSHIDHLFAIMKLCHEQEGIKPFIHAFTDGRDTLPREASKYFRILDEKIEKYGGELKTVVGRYFSMDRDNRWDRTRLAYEAIALGKGKQASSWEEVLQDAYASGESDEFIKPRVIDYSGMGKGDSVVFYNYRSDRPRQLTKALVERDFDEFDREWLEPDFVGMVKYYGDMPASYICEKPKPGMGLGEYFSKLGLKQYRIAETEKYAHVTYFFSGEREAPYPGEERVLVPSPKVATYDEKPDMSAYEITGRALEVLDSTDVMIMNFANCDMVGHTGDMAAAVKAVEAVDYCVGRLTREAISKGGVVFITADHGNAETMLTEDGGTVTSHTLARVPFCVVGWKRGVRLREGKLGDIAPTMLEVLGLEKPKEMTGKSLLS